MAEQVDNIEEQEPRAKTGGYSKAHPCNGFYGHRIITSGQWKI